MNYRIVEKPAFVAAGWTLRTACVNGQNFEEIPRFWVESNSNGKVNSLIPFAGSLGLIGLCAEWSESREEFTYFIAVEAPQAGHPLPEGTRGVSIPAATYAVFESVGPMPRTIQNVWNQAFSEWFPSSGYEHAGTPDFEVYPAFPPGDPRGDVTSDQYYSEVWIPLKKKV